MEFPMQDEMQPKFSYARTSNDKVSRVKVLSRAKNYAHSMPSQIFRVETPPT